MTPPQMHISLHWLSRVGLLASRTVGTPGTHGAVVTGIQGIGVRTPIAAAVAEATEGFAGDMHIPKGMMFTMGTLSIMLASGWFPVLTRFTGSTTKLLGAMPMLHWRVAPLQTCCAIWLLLSELAFSSILVFGCRNPHLRPEPQCLTLRLSAIALTGEVVFQLFSRFLRHFCICLLSWARTFVSGTPLKNSSLNCKRNVLPTRISRTERAGTSWSRLHDPSRPKG